MLGQIFSTIFGAKNVPAEVDPLHRALRTNVRPVDVGAGGVYRASFVSGIMAASLAGASPIFAVRWPESIFFMALRKLTIVAGTDVTAFAQGATIFDVIRAQSISAQYTGGQTLNLLGLSNVKSSQISKMSKLNVSNTATGAIACSSTATLSAGTPNPTLDNNPFGILVGSAGAAPLCLPVMQPGVLYDSTGPNDDPEEFYENEGFVIRATVPATGTWKFGVTMEWGEYDPSWYYA